jgi:integrase
MSMMTTQNGRPASLEEAITFGQCASRFLEAMRGSVPSTAKRTWRATLDRHALPLLGDLPVRNVTPGDVYAVLKPVWTTKPETARRLRARLELIFEFASAHGHLQGPNPATLKGSLEQRLTSQPAREVGTAPSLPVADVPAFIRRLKQIDSIPARALEFGILTLARESELVGMRWADIYEMSTWNIPGQSRKSGQPRRVLLSRAAAEVLERLPRHGELVFGSATDRPLSAGARLAILRAVGRADGERWLSRMGRPICATGFRNSFREWADAFGGDPHLAEVVLGAPDTQSFNRTSSLKAQLEMLEEWGNFCATGRVGADATSGEPNKR